MTMNDRRRGAAQPDVHVGRRFINQNDFKWRIFFQKKKNGDFTPVFASAVLCAVCCQDAFKICNLPQ